MPRGIKLNSMTSTAMMPRRKSTRIDDHSDNFIDFCCDNEYLGEDYTDEDLERCAHDEKIRNEYHDYRYDDMVQDLAETAADERDYYESERYEAERERYLLGED